MREVEEARRALARQRQDGARTWRDLRRSVHGETGWRPAGRWTVLLAAGAAGLALAWRWRRRGAPD